MACLDSVRGDSETIAIELIAKSLTWDVSSVIPRVYLPTRCVINQLVHEVFPPFLRLYIRIDFSKLLVPHVAKHVGNPGALVLDAGRTVREGSRGLGAVSASSGD